MSDLRLSEPEAELERIRDLLATMGGLIEGMLADTVTALAGKDSALARRVIARDREVNGLERDLDALAVRLIGGCRTGTTESRFLAATLKLTSSLERIGDLAVDTCRRACGLVAGQTWKVVDDVVRMGRLARETVASALEALVGGDASLARRVLRRNATLGNLHTRLIRRVIAILSEDPAKAATGTLLLAIGDDLARIGDLGKDLAEMVVFLLEGRDVRHEEAEAHPVGTPPPDHGVLFVGVAEAAPLQIAEGWAQCVAPPRVAIASAAPRVVPPTAAALQVMAEVGIDLSRVHSRPLSEVAMDSFDLVVSLCGEGEGIEVPPGVRHVHWSTSRFDDSDEIEGLRLARDHLALKVRYLFAAGQAVPGRRISAA